MKRAGFLLSLPLVALVPPSEAQVSTRWPIHSMDRPQPPVVTPAPVDRPAAPAADSRAADGSCLWRRCSSGRSIVRQDFQLE